MGEKLERELQGQLLQRLSEGYPEFVEARHLQPIAPGTALRVNIAYLDEHGLVEAKFVYSLDGMQLLSAKITANGLDFLANDGGLGAILGVVTVRLHEDTLKQLVEARIHASDLPEPDKRKFLDQLRELPAETTKHLWLKLVDAGLENWPRALPLLQNMLSG